MFPLHVQEGLDMFVPRVSLHRAVQSFSLSGNGVSVLQSWSFFSLPNSIFFLERECLLWASPANVCCPFPSSVSEAHLCLYILLPIFSIWMLPGHCLVIFVLITDFFVLSHCCTMYCKMLIGLEVTVCIIIYFLFCIVIIQMSSCNIFSITYYTRWFIVTVYSLHFRMSYVGSNITLMMWQMPFSWFLMHLYLSPGDIFCWTNSEMVHFAISTLMLENVLYFCFEYYSSSWRKDWINFIVFTMRKENTCMLNILVIGLHSKLFVVLWVIPKCKLQYR